MVESAQRGQTDLDDMIISEALIASILRKSLKQFLGGVSLRLKSNVYIISFSSDLILAFV